ncbi:MAG: hypothetical protein HY293_01790 [Planctomycetes bacterium]|nr:hypothetical protein [Planctomycetota bacterium]
MSAMKSGRVPLWLKLGWTVWVAVWMPAYWQYYGPMNFLWFCDIGNLLLTAALWRESRLLFSWQAVSVLLVQIMFSVDIAGRLTLGFHPIGGTEYMWNPEYPLYIRLLSLFHVATPVLLVWGVARLGYDRRALAAQTVSAWIVLPLAWLCGPARDINWTWGPFDKAQQALSPGLYLALCMTAFPILLYVPSHFGLAFLARRLGWGVRAEGART